MKMLKHIYVAKLKNPCHLDSYRNATRVYLNECLEDPCSEISRCMYEAAAGTLGFTKKTNEDLLEENRDILTTLLKEKITERTCFFDDITVCVGAVGIS